MISMDKTYRCDGAPMRILCIDAGGNFPVIGLFDSGTVLYFTAKGICTAQLYNLVEVGPYDDFKIDEPVMVRDEDHSVWQRSYFAGINQKSGKPEASYLTRWMREKPAGSCWLQCRRPTAEELAA